jgi:hypothetical protein
MVALHVAQTRSFAYFIQADQPQQGQQGQSAGFGAGLLLGGQQQQQQVLGMPPMQLQQDPQQRLQLQMLQAPGLPPLQQQQQQQQASPVWGSVQQPGKPSSVARAVLARH